MLMMLVMVLMISSMATADKKLPVKLVPAGYFISENLVQGIIERYPELADIFENAMQVEPGSYMIDSATIELGNKINLLEVDRDKWKTKYEVTHEVLLEERQTDDNINELLKLQIEDWKKQYHREQLQDIIQKAGLLAIIGLLATQN